LLTRWTAAVLEKEIRPSAHTWSAMGGSYLTGQSVIGVAAAGRTILAATFEEWAPTTTIASTGRSYGLYLSVDAAPEVRIKRHATQFPVDCQQLAGWRRCGERAAALLISRIAPYLPNTVNVLAHRRMI
jgi:hypothetical protein